MAEEKVDERTFGEIVLGLENAIKPFGFSIQSVDRDDGHMPLVFGEMIKHMADNGKLTITVVRHGRIGSRAETNLSMDGISVKA